MIHRAAVAVFYLAAACWSGLAMHLSDARLLVPAGGCAITAVVVEWITIRELHLQHQIRQHSKGRTRK